MAHFVGSNSWILSGLCRLDQLEMENILLERGTTKYTVSNTEKSQCPKNSNLLIIHQKVGKLLQSLNKTIEVSTDRIRKSPLTRTTWTFRFNFDQFGLLAINYVFIEYTMLMSSLLN